MPDNLSHSAVVLVAGLGVHVESNDARAVAAARERYPSAEKGCEAPCTLRIRVTPRAPTVNPSEPSDEATDLLVDDMRWQVEEARAVFTGTHVRGHADLAAGSASLEMDDAYLVSRRFRLGILEGLVYALLTRRDRHPIHAAAILEGDCALLLHGSSGVGKSTLAWSAHRAGLEVLADDSVRVQLTPALRVWGDGTPPRVRLLEDVARWDAIARDAPRDPDGKFVVDTRDPSRAWRPFAERARVCLLTRGHDVVLRRASPHEIEQAILAAPETRLDLAPGQRPGVVRALAAPGGWHLTLSSRAEQALPSIRAMLSDEP